MTTESGEKFDNSDWFQPKRHSDPLCRVVLVEPLIPENTGNIARTCVGTDSELHLVDPLGFEINESRVKRAGLDYWKNLTWQRHENYQAWRGNLPDPRRVFLIETNGTKPFYEAPFQRGDWIVFGKETSGLAPTITDEFHDQTYYIPMTGPTRSLNLSNAVAVVVFELYRQVGRQTGRQTMAQIPQT